MTHTWILNIYIQKFWFKNLKSVYTWIFNFYIQNFRYKNLKSIYNIFFFPFLSFLLLFFLPSKFQPLETPSKIEILIFFIILIISSPSGKYLDNRGFFQAIRTIWEISRLTRIFRGYPEIFQVIGEFSSLSRNFLDHLKNIQTIHQLSRSSGNFPDGQETSRYNFKNFPDAKIFPDGNAIMPWATGSSSSETMLNILKCSTLVSHSPQILSRRQQDSPNHLVCFTTSLEFHVIFFSSRN